MIKVILPKEIDSLMNNRHIQLGLYLCFEGNKVIGIDNTSADAWIEEFDNVDDTIAWLRNPDAAEKIKKYKVKIGKTLETNKLYTKAAAVSLAANMESLTDLKIEILEVF